MKKIVALALCLVMVLGLMTGCQKAIDAKTVYQNMTDAMKTVTAQSADVEMDVEMKMSTMGMTMTVGVALDMTSMVKSDLSSMYMDMSMEMKALGETEETKMEMYGTVEDGALVYYIYESTEDMWIKTAMNEYTDIMGQLNGLTLDLTNAPSESLSLAKSQETINDRKCYKLTEQIDGAVIQEQMGDYMTQALSQMTGAEDLDEESMAQLEAVMKEFDWSKLSGSVVYYVDMETFLPVETSMEILGMGDVFNSMISTLMEQAAAEEDMKRRSALKDELAEKSGQLIGAAGEIRDQAYMVKEAVERINTDQTEGKPKSIKEETQGAMESLLAAMKNMERVYNEFAERSGTAAATRSEHVLEGCEKLEIRDGRLIVELAGNSGVIAFVD